MNDNEAQELVEEIISCANTIPKNMLDDKIIVSGLSYWHVDRKEIDDILTTIGAKSNVYMVNPNPPKVLNAVLSCIFDNLLAIFCV